MTPIRRILMAFRLPEALRDVLAGVTAYAKQHACNWQVLCVDAEEFEPNLAHHGADGTITSIRLQNRRLINRLRRTHTRVVNMLHNLCPALPSVLSDDRAIGKSGAEYLLGRGFREFAFLGISTPWSRFRQAGFLDAVRAAGLRIPTTIKSLAVADFQFASRVRATTALRRWVRALPAQCGVMAACDFAARTLLDAAQAEGIRVPQDIATLGVDNFHTICELSPVPLSSVAQDFERMGFEAASLLDLLMKKRSHRPAGPILVPPGRLFVRESTDVLAFEDPSVVAALRIIHEHAATGIGMKQLLKQVPLSRRWLDARFKQLVGHTTSQEIRRCRLQFVRDLLEETDMPLRGIAARCQFSCSENFIRWFRAGAGVPPNAYRLGRRPSVSRRDSR